MDVHIRCIKTVHANLEVGKLGKTLTACGNVDPCASEFRIAGSKDCKNSGVACELRDDEVELGALEVELAELLSRRGGLSEYPKQ